MSTPALLVTPAPSGGFHALRLNYAYPEDLLAWVQEMGYAAANPFVTIRITNNH